MWNDLPFSVFDTGKLVGFKGSANVGWFPELRLLQFYFFYFLFLLRPVLLVLIIILLMFIRRCNILIFFYPFSRNILVTKLMSNHMPNLVRLWTSGETTIAWVGWLSSVSSEQVPLMCIITALAVAWLIRGNSRQALKILTTQWKDTELKGTE